MNNTKLLVIFSLLVTTLGLGFLFLGLQPTSINISPSPSPANESQPQKNFGILVTKVIDGDTIEIETGEKVRLLGVDTPETVDPRRPVECFGKEASNKLKELIEGKSVILEKDISETDKYNRLLRFIYLPLDPSTGSRQLLFVNDYMIREGFAKTLTIPPDVKFAEKFLQAQIEARVNSRGLWGSC